MVEALLTIKQEAPDDRGHDLEMVCDSDYEAAELQGICVWKKEVLLTDTGMHVLHETRTNANVLWRCV